jgi:adenylate cyclase
LADIFLSYSSRDRLQAKQLRDLLSGAGYSVWIDQSGIDFATSWSGEIVEAIEACAAFLVLLSQNSVASENVAKELVLASEQKKKILPVDLEPVELPRDLRYHLAGIQRAFASDTDAILKALDNLGLSASGAKTESVRTADQRKSLIILPFEDLSPAQDNQWFADGLAGELIDALANIRSLRILDRKTSMELRGVKQSTVEIGKLFNTRYFIEGTVRKFGEEIKISISLLDIATGDTLWQFSHRGEFKDIFDIQEAVAKKVVEGLRLHLTKEEATLISERGTDNADAYELFVKASERFRIQTKESLSTAVELLASAIEIDPAYTDAYQLKARVLTNLARQYDRNPDLLAEAEKLCHESLRLKPDLFESYHPLMQVYILEGKLEEAERIANELVRIQPDNFMSYFSLGFFYDVTDQCEKAIAPYEEAVRLNQDYLMAIWNLCASCGNAHEEEKLVRWSSFALPRFERHIKLHPDDEIARTRSAALLLWTGRKDDARKTALELQNARDPLTLFNIACLLGEMKEKVEALRMFRKAIEAGLRNPRMKDFLTDPDQGVPELAGTPEYEEVRLMVEEIEKETASR